MPDMDGDLTLLDTNQVSFLNGPVAINVASRDVAMTPSVARGYGCRVSGDRRHITVFVSVLRSRVLLRDLGAGAPIAVVFTRPRSHETLQIKGACAEVQRIVPGDHEIMQAYGEAFGEEIRGLGYADQFARAIMAPVDEEAVGLVFVPNAIFEQTPGPAAGKRLAPGP